MKMKRAALSHHRARPIFDRVIFALVRSLGVFLLLSVLLVVGLSACRRAPEVEKVTLRLSGPHSVEWAGLYAAQLEGYYAAENLDVTILPAADASSSADVLAGEADFGVMSGGDLLLARARSEPLVAVFAILRRSPLAVMALAENGIVQPRDLRSKRVGIVSADMRAVKDVQFLSLMEQVSVTLAELEAAPVGEEGIAPLVEQRVDAIAYAWATRDAMAAREAGYEVTLSYFFDYGVLEYPYVIFTDASTIARRPDLPARFVRATLAGYRHVLINPDRAAELTLSYDPSLNLEAQQAMWQALIPFIDTGDAPVGTMEEGVWQSTQWVFLNHGLLEAPVALNDLYTNQFVAQSGN